MAASLLDSFTGDPFQSKLVLRINISVVSNGCCSSIRADQIKGLIGRGRANGKGLAKLTVSYCLYCRETGAVAVAKQISRSEEQSYCREEKSGKSVLLELEEDLRNEISKEVKFACCSRLPEWSQLSRLILEVDNYGPGHEDDKRRSSATEYSCSTASSCL